jgi:hypothetical protein
MMKYQVANLPGKRQSRGLSAQIQGKYSKIIVSFEKLLKDPH